jgi:hypothetical protein
MKRVGGSAVVASYSPRIFQELNAFQVAKKLLADNRDSINQLGDVICAHNMHEHVGICLLHRHYGLSAQERVVRRFSQGEALIQPERIDEAPDAIPYLWKSDASGDQPRFFPLEFSTYPDALHAVAARDAEAVANSPQFLADMSQKLSDLGLSNLFGIATMHSRQAFALQPEDVILESPGDGDRVLWLRPVSASAVTEETTETLWGFTPVVDTVDETDPAVTNGLVCVNHCNNHCINHCISHCYHKCLH